MKPLRILLLSPWMPWPPHDGGRIRILNTLRYLSQRHQVTLVAPSRNQRDADRVSDLQDLCEDVVTAELPNSGRAIVGRMLRGAFQRRALIQSIHYGPALAAQIRQLTADRAYDIVQIEFSWFTPYLRALHEGCRARTVLTMHNVESLRFARELRSTTTGGRRLALSWDQLFAGAWEQQAVRGIDAVAVVSETERRWVEQVAPGTLVTVAPNGVDTDHFQPVASPGNGSVVFTGAMDYPPNIDAILWFCREVWPIVRRRAPALRLEVVGRSPDARVRALNGEAGIRVTGEVADVRILLAQASAVVVPLRAGAGTRLKILEAMAMARPVISTRLGAEGLDVADGSDILLADTPGDFADAVESVVQSPAVADRLGEAGRRLTVAQYDWKHCLRPLETLYERLLEPEGSAVGAGRPRPGLPQGERVMAVAPAPALRSLLRCPGCSGALESLRHGLSCDECDQVYPLSDGVPRLLPATLSHELEATRQGFGYQQTVMNDGALDPERWHRQFASLRPVEPEWFCGQRGIDLGCGAGRFLYCSVAYGATMVGLDLSAAVDTARRRIDDTSGCLIVQGDLHRAPFEPASFDFAYSLGVLHHLPDPEAGFRALTRLVRPGGLVWCWVYGLEGMRWWYRASHLRWLRPFTTRLPLWGQEATTALVTAALEVGLWTPTRLLGRLPGGPTWTRRIPLSHACRSSFRGKIASFFDRLNPPLTHFHTRPELEDWCRRAGLSDWQVTNRDRRGWLVWGRTT